MIVLLGSITIFLTASCALKNNIVLLDFSKNITEQYPEYHSVCSTWILDSCDILIILQYSVPTHFNEIDALYSTLPCEYAGNILINDKHSNFWINAGGYLIILRENIYSYYIYSEKNFFDFFIVSPYDPTKEENQ
jgi:hypothetical protein